MDKIIFNQLKRAMSDYAYPNYFILKELGKSEVVGIFCTCSVFVTKDKSLERVKKVLAENNYPYTISEKGMENTKHFEIKF